MVNAAGIEGDAGALWEQSPARFETVMRVNCTGTFLGMRAVVPAITGLISSRLKPKSLLVARDTGALISVSVNKLAAVPKPD